MKLDKEIISKRISPKHKNNKVFYYINGFFNKIFNSRYKKNGFEKFIKQNISKYNKEYIDFRLNYYNKLSDKQSLPLSCPTIGTFKMDKNFKTYFFDFAELKNNFHPDLRINCVFGDVTHIPEVPSFVKSRPIEGNNQNSILLNLNKIRHFLFINDEYKYQDKIDMLVWRGKVKDYQDNRNTFLQKHINNPLCDAGCVNNYKEASWIRPRLTIDEQLKYKFILSVEGNDVATNLKWIMSSNSIVVMSKPKFETWFMEATLVPDYHYISVNEDFSNLDEKIKYYLNNQEKALEIIKNANAYVEQFKDKKREKLISLLVMEKYFKLAD